MNVAIENTTGLEIVKSLGEVAALLKRLLESQPSQAPLLAEETDLSVVERNIRFIQETIGQKYGVPRALMVSKRRPDWIIRARHLAMALAYELAGASLNEVGANFGGRDHGTVFHAAQNVRDWCDVDPKYKQEVDGWRTFFKKHFESELKQT